MTTATPSKMIDIRKLRDTLDGKKLRDPRIDVVTFLLFILISTSNTALTEGQGGAIRGQIYARDYLGNYVPVGFANIIAESEFFATTIRTDSNGYYLAYLPAGTYDVTVTLSTVTLDYSQSKTVVVWDGSDTTINFYLEPIVRPAYSPMQVMISIDGLPSYYTVNLRVDDSLVGSIPGGGTFRLEVDDEVRHVISTEQYVEVSEGERFYCQANIWHIDELSYSSSENIKAAHSFQYATQYHLSVSTIHGDAAKKSGWYTKGSSVSLSAPQAIEVSQGAREVFDSWTVLGSTVKDPSTTVALNSPLDVKTEYHREYYLQLISERGQPSGSGWYKEGTTAEIRVDRESALPGFIGALGGMKIFDGWSGEVSSTNNRAFVLMDSPKTVAAKWRDDYSITYIVVISPILIAIALVTVFRKRHTNQTRQY